MSFPVPGRIAEQLRRSTVQIRGESGRMQGSGSGIVLNNGRILTNAHVLTGQQLNIETWDGAMHRSSVAKADRRRDLALLTVDGLSAPAASLAAQVPRTGQPVIAVGNPLGFVGAVSTGFVHQVGPVRALGGSRWIQSDLRLAPGNSGGPLADIHGQIVGVNTMIAGHLALAVPVDAVQTFLSSNGSPRTLGVTVRPVWVRTKGNPPRYGLMLLEMNRGGPAERASLLPGDILVSAFGRNIESADDLYDALSAKEVLSLGFIRGNALPERRVSVQLAPGPVVNAA